MCKLRVQSAVLCVLSISVCISLTNTLSYDQYNYPNPQTDPDVCGHGGTLNWVCDPGEVLTSQEAQFLDYLSSATYHESECICDTVSPVDCGFRIAVAVVPQITGYGRYADSEDALTATQLFAKYLIKKWDFGKCDNDLVTVLAVAERKIWTKQGDRKHIDDRCITKIYEDNKQHLSDGDYGTGLVNIFQSYRQHITKKESCPQFSPGEIAGITIGSLAGFGLLLSFCYCCWCTEYCENFWCNL